MRPGIPQKKWSSHHGQQKLSYLEPSSPALQVVSFPSEPPGKPINIYSIYIMMNFKYNEKCLKLHLSLHKELKIAAVPTEMKLEII